MPPAVRNLVNLSDVSIGYAGRPVLAGVTLGLAAGERIGVVGRNGDGKSTLMRLIAGTETPDSGAVTHSSGVITELVAQESVLDPAKTIREELVGTRADHEWAGDAAFRDVLGGLLGGVTMERFADGIDTRIGALSGGERRRVGLARALLDGPELLLLDEPTNHLDIEGVQWLAAHLTARRGTLMVITHDRWFLDAVCERTWEVADGAVHQYDGGYAAYVLAKAERERQAASREDKRQQLMRKELAWLRRGPPARTSKPKFRIEAATALIADEPEPRNTVELLRFAGARLGKQVIDAVDVSLSYGDKVLLRGATWRIGPGDRLALVGVNGSGKTSLMRLLAGAAAPTSGTVTHGQTVRLAYLSQETAELDGGLRVLESLEMVRARITTSDGEELTATTLCDRFGFRGGRQRALVSELSGGERRRLQLMRLLMGEPNVLLLDEPTNDVDIDTLTALEDLLDTWPGTLVVISHDRYFVERVCDDVHSLSTDGQIRHLPRGIDQYLEERRSAAAAETARAAVATPDANPGRGAERHAARKDLHRIERALAKTGDREAVLLEQMAHAASDPGRLRELSAELAAVRAEQAELEEAWLEAGERADG